MRSRRESCASEVISCDDAPAKSIASVGESRNVLSSMVMLWVAAIQTFVSVGDPEPWNVQSSIVAPL